MSGAPRHYGNGLDCTHGGARHCAGAVTHEPGQPYAAERKISATIKGVGAELCSLEMPRPRDCFGRQDRHGRAIHPLLFPIVGRLKNDQLRYRGKTYHDDAARFLRAIIDFPGFSVSRTYVGWFFTMSRIPAPLPIRISPGSHLCGERRRVEVTLRIDNFGDDVLPASIGAHPAFNWPLSPELAKDEYHLTFSNERDRADPPPEEGLMRATPEPTRSTARRWRCPNGCLTMMRSFWTCWRVHRSAIQGAARTVD